VAQDQDPAAHRILASELTPTDAWRRLDRTETERNIIVAEIRVPISPGELIDKITILEIKSERMSDPAKLANVRLELELLEETWRESDCAQIDIGRERRELKRINEQLWVIEDEIRDKERERAFDARFIELARAVYVTNDERASIKRRINDRLGSRIVEEKSYSDYRGA
jgi:hypothetical protein